MSHREFIFIGGEPSGCDCCRIDTGESEFGCGERQTVFTRRELEVLKQIRDVSREARSLKESSGRFGLSTVDEELKSLRERRRSLEEERVAAAEERMRLLGHL